MLAGGSLVRAIAVAIRGCVAGPEGRVACCGDDAAVCWLLRDWRLAASLGRTAGAAGQNPRRVSAHDCGRGGRRNHWRDGRWRPADRDLRQLRFTGGGGHQAHPGQRPLAPEPDTRAGEPPRRRYSCFCRNHVCCCNRWFACCSASRWTSSQLSQIVRACHSITSIEDRHLIPCAVTTRAKPCLVASKPVTTLRTFQVERSFAMSTGLGLGQPCRSVKCAIHAPGTGRRIAVIGETCERAARSRVSSGLHPAWSQVRVIHQ